jgi:hypothetical protein
MAHYMTETVKQSKRIYESRDNVSQFENEMQQGVTTGKANIDWQHYDLVFRAFEDKDDKALGNLVLPLDPRKTMVYNFIPNQLVYTIKSSGKTSDPEFEHGIIRSGLNGHDISTGITTVGQFYQHVRLIGQCRDIRIADDFLLNRSVGLQHTGKTSLLNTYGGTWNAFRFLQWSLPKLGDYADMTDEEFLKVELKDLATEANKKGIQRIDLVIEEVGSADAFAFGNDEELALLISNMILELQELQTKKSIKKRTGLRQFLGKHAARNHRIFAFTLMGCPHNKGAHALLLDPQDGHLGN